MSELTDRLWEQYGSITFDRLPDDHPLRRLSRTASGTSHLHQLTRGR